MNTIPSKIKNFTSQLCLFLKNRYPMLDAYHFLTSFQQDIYDILLDNLYARNLKSSFQEQKKEFFECAKRSVSVPQHSFGQKFDPLKLLLQQRDINHDYKHKTAAYVSAGIGLTLENMAMAAGALKGNAPFMIVEDGFLRSITNSFDKSDPFYTFTSFTMDDLTHYVDATKPSRLELMLNDKELQLTSDQLARAERLIQFIIEHKISKYNSQPLLSDSIGTP